MDVIFFPSKYKKALLNKTKNSTIRIKNELGKYKIGKIYSVKSYANRNWNVEIKVLKIFSITLSKLGDYSIPKQSIKAIQKNKGISFNSKVELIYFKVL